ncbi:RagB/SusD family nutrient uptake outer membrane protein [Olivibacter sp. SDN3]|uniref:RagB/SusD family nutrient uptake outer membrane protein n=1 Tax=Olivibacter sp. SDN3 TaxID=2764720 RepID=UPI0016517AA9|nr:RagB/SusD family nutrient uptake outer membrane protein [Olivibacter sp. SDN3]QNL49923.1 RagB/SusD family nutrient uptake outer membrane protein [Olivibacter sp. SDN3]
MRNYIKKSISISLISTCLIAFQACTKLDENPYSEIREDEFLNNRREVLQAALRPFTHMQAWLGLNAGEGYYYHNELSADQLAWPQKGRHGYDAGDHFRQHYHTWTDNETRMRQTWILMWTGVGYVNNALKNIEAVNAEEIGMEQEELSAIIAELRVLRAYHYMKIMDLWGNVPIAIEVAESIDNPETKARAEVFEFIQTELEEYVPQLFPLSEELIGRVSKAAGYATLAELYLNAEKWTGTAMWDECIAACDQVINGDGGGLAGGPNLADDLKQNFSNTNQRSPENLFQFAYSRKGGFSIDFSMLSGYDYMREVLNVGYGGINAFVVVPTAFDAYAENDLRKEEWFLFGPQYRYGTTTPVLGTEEYDGQPFIIVNSIRRESEGDTTSEGSMAEGEENSGARFHKYKSGTLSDENYLENHYIIYRLTEIYFNKAEAIMRKNGGTATQEAVNLINESRRRAFSTEDWPEAQYTTATLTLDELLAERGREFIFEGKRRTDLIRFGKFTTASWWDHTPGNDPNKELYAIPNTQIAINPNLQQNPGY